jgi:flavin-dependent dehydrogenase
VYDAVVIGGGLAGCAAARGLALRGHSVLLLESERYPVHKVCGEFLSPEAGGLLRALGVEEAVWAAGAVPIRRVAITSPAGTAWEEALPAAGIGLSRWALDPLLFDGARAAGAEALQGARATSVEGDGGSGFRVAYAHGGAAREAAARLVLGAFGKRSRLDRELDRAFLRRSHDFVAFKAHHAGADLGDCVELHAFPGGYCGMSHVEGGLVNVCLIARTDALRRSGRSFEGLREGAMRANPTLARRLDALEPAGGPVVSVSQIPFAIKELFARDVMMVGDTAGMIAPLCGDGMAMALRSAEVAADMGGRFLAGGMTFEALRRAYTRAWQGEFAPRLRLARALQRGLFEPRAARVGLTLLARAPWLGRALIRATRGPVTRPGMARSPMTRTP